MANINITPVTLGFVQLLSDGERAEASVFNRPIATLSDNQQAQNVMLDEIYTVLGSANEDLDTMQELADEIVTLTANFDGGEFTGSVTIPLADSLIINGSVTFADDIVVPGDVKAQSMHIGLDTVATQPWVTGELTSYYTKVASDDRYNTKAEITSLLGGYYTETESNNRYLSKASDDIKTGGYLRLNDNLILALGTGADAEFFCNGSNMYMDLNSGIGNFYIRDGATTRFTFDDAGHFTATGNVTAYSDRKLKTNIELISNSTEKLLTLSGYTFDRTDIETPRQTGVIAQEVQAVLPEAVTESEDGTLGVAYGNMVGLLIETIKELEARITILEGE